MALEEVDRPTAADGEVLVDLQAASLCGSDLHYLDPDSAFEPSTAPVTLGHEGAGVVADVGEGVTGLAVGDRVLVNYVLSCGRCRPCLEGHDNRCRNRTSVGHDVDGTFAEYVAVPARSAVPMSSAVPYEWGSLTGCAVATGYHALARADIAPGDAVLVTGAGGVGSSATMWADFRGAGTVLVSDVVDAKLDRAREMGADETIDAADESVGDRVEAATDGRGVDAAIECSGAAPAMEQAVAAVDGDNRFESGTVVSVGLQEEPLEVRYWGLREGALMVSGDHTGSELGEIVRLLEAEKVDPSPLITHRFDLADVDEAVETLEDPDEAVGRIVLDVS
jgi:D-arabinose 1-dehydrogenase-like Zn-dependent alcohol dehydrogenase